jgi:hypothetical protein
MTYENFFIATFWLGLFFVALSVWIVKTGNSGMGIGIGGGAVAFLSIAGLIF